MAGRHLILMSPDNAVRRALSLMHLESFFAIASDLPSALRLIETRVREGKASVGLRTAAARNPVRWQGEITAANCEQAWNETRAHIENPPQSGKLIIDLAAVRFVDSSGLGVMVRAKRLARGKNVELAFMNPTPAVQNVVRLARLDDFILSSSTVLR